MWWLRALIPVLLLLPGPATAVTLTLTPDKTTYAVGETITLNVFGDADGVVDSVIFGRLLFDPGLAAFVSGTQQLLTSFSVLTWSGNPDLSGGPGFVDAFNQISPFVGGGSSPDGPLTSSATLLATAPGTLDLAWEASYPWQFDFFGLVDAPGTSVTIVPEPSTALLLALGLAATALAPCRRASRPTEAH